MPRGTAFRYQLSERATVTILIRRAKGKQRKVATLVRRNVGPGSVVTKFTGRIRKRALPAGNYRATLTARDAAGNLSRPGTVRFTVVRP